MKKRLSKSSIWIIVLVISYILFLISPLNFELGNWESTNIFKTIFSYVSIFSFIMVIITLTKEIREERITKIVDKRLSELGKN